ncbi:MAG: hypothetical protein SNJ84_06780 [Verrucomicrobiia bacterium]
MKMGLEAVIKEVPNGEKPSRYPLTSRSFEEPGHLGSSGVGDLSSNKKHLKSFSRRKFTHQAVRAETVDLPEEVPFSAKILAIGHKEGLILCDFNFR